MTREPTNAENEYVESNPPESRLREALENIVEIGQIAIGNATINRMVSIARSALAQGTER